MIPIKANNGIVTTARFLGAEFSCDIRSIKYLNSNDPEYLARKWRPVEYSKDFAFTVSWAGMTQKLVKSRIVDEEHPKPFFERKMRWKLSRLTFDIPDLEQQVDIPVNGKVLFVSDIHLGSADIDDFEAEKSLISLLDHLKPDILVFLGDVIDIWALAPFNKDTEDSNVVKSVNKMKGMFENFCCMCRAVLYIPGNHDGAIGQVGNSNRNLLQFDWKIENLVVCEKLCLRGTLPIPEFGELLPAFAASAHGHEESRFNRPGTLMGRYIASAYQSALQIPLLQSVRRLRPWFENIPFVGDWEHRELLNLGKKFPDVSFIAGHTHRPFVTIQKCEATFYALSSNYSPIEDRYRWYVNIGTWGYSRTYLVVDGFIWRLDVYK